jgi:NADH-quinone oxidoreductase subunit D
MINSDTRAFYIESEEIGDLGAKKMVVNFGPQHPATHGTLRNVIALDGELVKEIVPEIGFLHSGFEKLAEYRTYNQTVTITDRMNYLSPLCNNVAFSLACERLLGIETTPRCHYIRVIMCELSRIADHILSVGLQAMDLGAFSVMLWTFTEREKLYDIFEMVTGARLTTSYTRVGGLARDVPPDFDSVVKRFLKECTQTLNDLEDILNDNKIFVDRTKGIGCISAKDAIDYGVTGPILRAAGVAHDIRKAHPYCSYEKFNFEVPVEKTGDVYERYRIRMREMRESVKIVEQALGGLPTGPLNYHNPEVIIPAKEEVYQTIEGLIYHFKNFMFGHGIRPQKGEVYFPTESPNGELAFYLISDGTEKPFRMRVRPPSFYNYQAVPLMVRNTALSDVVSVLGSMNIIAGELDR